MPSVVTAGVPNRRPLVYQGPLGSNGIGIAIERDPAAADRLLGLAAGDSRGSTRRPARSRWLSVPPVRTLQPVADERFGEGPGIGDDLPRIVGELGPQGLGEGDRLGGHHVGQRASQHQRAAAVDVLLELFGAQHQAPARSAQGLVRRRRHDVGVGDRVVLAREHLAGDQTGEVGHVDHQDGADPVGDLAHPARS